MPRPCLSLLAAVSLWPLAAAAQTDHRLPAVVCVPGDPTTMQYENKPITAGTISKPGRTTPPRVYFCPIHNPVAETPQAPWNKMEMTYLDNTGVKGNITLRLFAKSRAVLPTDPPLGSTFVIATMNSLPAASVTRLSVTMSSTLDFSRFTYWWVLDLKSPGNASAPQIDVHELALTN